MGIFLLIIIFIALFLFDLWFGGLLTKEIDELSNSYDKLKRKDPSVFKKIDGYYGKEIDEYMHKSPEAFPVSLVTNFIDLIKVSKLNDRVKSS